MALKRNLIANYLGQGWTAVMSLAFIPLYIKYLGIEAYGLIGLFAVLQAWLGLLDMGMTPTLGREMARFTGGGHSNESIRDLLRSIEIIAIVVAVVIAGGVALGSNWIAAFWLKAGGLQTEEVTQALTIMGLVAALRFLEGVYRSTIVGLQRQVLFNVLNCLIWTMRGVGAIVVLALVSPTIEAFFLWQGTVSIFGLFILACATYRIVPAGERSGQFSVSALRSVWRFAGGMFSATLLALLLTQIDKILLSKLLTLTDFGYYALAAAVAGGLYLLAGPITQATYPRLCQQHASRNERAVADEFHRGAQLVSVFFGSAAIVMILFAETFLVIWTQDTQLTKGTANLLKVLALGTLLHGLVVMPYQLQLTYGWTRLSVLINVVAVIFIVPAIWWVTPMYGAIGASWIWVILTIGYLLLHGFFTFQRLLPGQGWHWCLEDLLKPLAAAFLTAATFRVLWQNFEAGAALQLLQLAVVSTITVIVALLAANRVRDKLLLTVRQSLLPRFHNRGEIEPK